MLSYYPIQCSVCIGTSLYLRSCGWFLPSENCVFIVSSEGRMHVTFDVYCAPQQRRLFREKRPNTIIIIISSIWDAEFGFSRASTGFSSRPAGDKATYWCSTTSWDRQKSTDDEWMADCCCSHRPILFHCIQSLLSRRHRRAVYISDVHKTLSYTAN